MDLLTSLAGVAASAAPLSMPLVPTEGVYYDLGIPRDGNNLSNNTTVDPRLMKLNERGNDSFERRKKIAQGFIDFILTNSTLGVPSC